MAVLRTAIITVCVLTLVGCGYSYNDEDRLTSMLPYEQFEIPLPSSKTVGQPETLSPQKYLLTYSGSIFGIDEAHAAPVASLEQIDGNGHMLMLNWEEGGIGKRGIKRGCTVGGAAPVSEDGYFITACHILIRESNWLIYRSGDEENPSVECSEFRIVYANKDSDVAIVKADIATPRFLSIRSSPLEEGEPLFAGSWQPPTTTGGRFVGSEQPSIKNNPNQSGYYKIRVTNPLRNGDSGSPLIDSKGRLCGVVSRIHLGRWIKRKTPEAYAVMLDQGELLRIIEEDRASNQGLQVDAAARRD